MTADDRKVLEELHDLLQEHMVYEGSQNLAQFIPALTRVLEEPGDAERKAGDVLAIYNAETKAGMVVRILHQVDADLWCVEESSDKPKRTRFKRCWNLSKERIAQATLVYRPELDARKEASRAAKPEET